MPPKPQTVFLNRTGKFTCDASGGDYTFWKVNGTSVSNIKEKDLKYSGHSGNGSSTLTLKARADFNGTAVQCVTGYFMGVAVESEKVTLTIQGS